ncbi:TonB-dependent receptor [Pelagibius sp. Alg239-R121]|uniref:TonB-dependent receptor n=1 Tax=Pelagibius sp. Alg239-R121 TaxID=2993448 RepID=UPI0024A6A3C2|nr:TonB-dependent receptor [Pelagibius sp. Alg239-R121]
MGRRLTYQASMIVLAASLVSVAESSRAQEELGKNKTTASKTTAPVELEPIVNTATRAPRPVSAIPGSVVVIDREQIEQQLSISSDPADILSKFVPGYSSSNQTVSGSAESFRGRGVQVLVDGVSRNTPLRNVSRIISLIDLNQVERIEVVNGASSIYGNGATGGVINFITKKSTDGKPSLGFSTGLRAFTADVKDSLAPEASIRLSGDNSLFDYLAVVSGEMTRDTFDGDGDRLPDDPLIGQGAFANGDSYNGLVKVGRDFDSKRIELTAELTRFDQRPEFYSDYSTDPVSVDFADPYNAKSIYEDSNYQALKFDDTEFALGNLSIQAFRNDIEKRFADARISVANPAVYINPDEGQTTLTADQLGLRTTVDTKLDSIYDSLSLTWGFDFTHDETSQHFQDGVEAIAPMEQDSYAGFVQAEIAPMDWLQLRGGIRYERFKLELEDFTRPSYSFLVAPGVAVPLPAVDVTGGTATYSETVFNIGAVVYLSDEVEVFGAFSQGYSLPDVGGFTRRAGLGAVGPVDFSDIAPEAQLVDNYEVGMRGEWERVRGSLSAYISESDLGTTFDVSTNQVSQQKERVYGLEAIAEADITEQLVFGGVFSWSEGKRDTDDDGDLDSYLPNNRIGPPLRLTGYVNYETDFDLNLRLEGVYTGSRDRNDGVQQVKIDNALTFNLAADYPLLDGTLSLGVENILDVEYENPTASASRNRPVNGFGRVVSMRYSRTF